MKTTRVHKKERLLPAFGFRMLVVSLLLIFVATMPLTVADQHEYWHLHSNGLSILFKDQN